MNYVNRFSDVDALVTHLTSALPSIGDPILVSRYVGFLCVSMVTVFELSIKDIFVEFSNKKHKIFGSYCGKMIERMNGRIMIKDLRDDHIKKFGDKYVARFVRLVDSCDRKALQSGNISIKAAYGNVIVWRNSFAHQGVLPANANFSESCKGYDAGKVVLRCLAGAMTR